MEKKKKYVAPVITVHLIELEDCLAAQSISEIRVGDPYNPDVPKLEDWNDRGSVDFWDSEI